MKTLFIPAGIKTKVNEEKIKNLSKILPDEILIAYSIQYKDIAFEIKNLLKDRVKGIVQTLGCRKPVLPKGVKAILLIGSGRFHALSLASSLELPIYILDNNKLEKLDKGEIESFKGMKKAAYLKFLNSDEVGIIISTKPGQENLKRALNLKKTLKDKKFYLFIANEITNSEFENFNTIQSWINTACPRLDMNFPLVNIEDLNF